MIELRSVHFGYGGATRRDEPSFAIDVPDLMIAEAHAAACIGPSGSGKTTLVNLIAGILVPDRGSVRVGSVEVSSLGDAARRAFRLKNIGMVFQEFELLEHLTALDNILLPVLIGPASERGAAEEAVAELARALGITHVLRRKPRRLSHGERQRVGICRALVTRPSVLLCDEPTGNLDPEATEATLDLLMEHAKRCGSTLVMVTHNHTVLPRFDRVIDMRELCGRAPALAPPLGGR